MYAFPSSHATTIPYEFQSTSNALFSLHISYLDPTLFFLISMTFTNPAAVTITI